MLYRILLALILLASPVLGETFGYIDGAGQLGVNQTWSYSNRYPPDVYGASGGEILTELWALIQSPSSGYTVNMGLYTWSQSDSCANDSLVTAEATTGTASFVRQRFNMGDYELSANDTVTCVVGEFQTGTWYIGYNGVTDAGEEHVASSLPASLTCDSRDDWRLDLIGCLNQEGAGGALGHAPTEYNLGTRWSNPGNAVNSLEGLPDDDDQCATYDDKYQDWLCLHAFGFSIPTDATVDSVEAQLQGLGTTSTPDSKRQAEIDLTVDSTNAEGISKIYQLPYSGISSCNGGDVDSVFTSGLPTASEINGRGFGVMIRDNDSGANELDFDAVWVTVYFTPAGGAGEDVSYGRRRNIIMGDD
jgi:hypothetical protein